MTRIFWATLFAILMIGTAQAQQQGPTAWVQIEAQPSLAQARNSIRGYATRLEDVNGFSLGGGWYAIALGPYSPDDAARVLQVYRAEGVIPRDSYIADNNDYRQQFWPIGANFLTSPALVPTPPASDTPPENAAIPDLPDPDPIDETPAEARASERILTREDRAELQEALKWAGFYDGGIDAAFGRGTRGAMARWQAAQGYQSTGILTTRQRAELLQDYNAVLADLGLDIVRDPEAGIEIKLPTDIVGFEKYEPPFAHYTPVGDVDARVLLISQRGDNNTLAGLYDIMQTLEIVPETGPRSLNDDAFTLIGESALVISHTQAWLQDGEIKGFTLIWPAGDEERRTRLLGEMQESFARLDGALAPTAGNAGTQSIDLVSGLEIRKPRLSRSGFYVDGNGMVVTTADVVRDCRRITIDQDHEAEIATQQDGLGIAVLRPLETLAPLAVATLQNAVPRLQSEIAVAGYSYGGILGAPTVTFGQLADLKGLDGESGINRLALNALDGDIGGPVVDAAGSVLGMLLPDGGNGRTLPEGVRFALDAGALRKVLEEAGINPASPAARAPLQPEALTDHAKGMTVLVSCWD
ncbi:Putative peptidoglycan binding domain-containing protein [Roseovarius pacificus]|uniref:Putative peptidoglycan binding domain-containing protein n=1 Tax=Roseovarius pacificus TaxID=337701 RepID=A0A1M7DB02_9RHOB|nr:serine protease [Roseovarius pacificus]GGO56684.1 peptidoglycan-binding protein [Roseovarius pacificus]SHL76587.1 Putative peptidoglycan binding domain-containing protein [Roseovarius pacificus]